MLKNIVSAPHHGQYLIVGRNDRIDKQFVDSLAKGMELGVMNNHLTAESHPIGQVLAAANAPWDVSEAHGACCGWACLGGVGAIKAWTAELLGSVDDNDALAGERQRSLYEFAANIVLQLERGDLGFGPLLPSDDSLLDTRAAGLADWCQGFMHGLAAGGGSDAERVKAALGQGVTLEILDDFSEITRAAVGQEADEAAEQAYAELVEYVRVSAQLIYDETASLRNHSEHTSEKVS